MGKSSSPPPGPDYASLIPLQQQANLGTFNTMLNASRANQITPFGSSTWSFTPSSGGGGGAYNSGRPATPGTPGTAGHYEYDTNQGGQYWVPGTPGTPGTPASGGSYDPAAQASGGGQWTNTVTLSPDQQQLYNNFIQGSNNQANLANWTAQYAGQQLARPVDFSGAPSLISALKTSQFANPTYANGLTSGQDFSKQAADAVYNQATRYLQPQQDAQRRQLEARLGEQGFVPGTPAYDQAMGEFQRNQDLAYQNARDSATTQGFNVGNQFFQNELAGRNLQRNQTFDANSVAQQLFNQQAQAGNFANNARNQYISELLTQRAVPFNEYNSVRTGMQMPQPGVTSNFASPALQNVDLMGAANQGYQNQIAGYNAQVGGNNALLGMLGSLGGALLGGSGGSSLLSNLSGLIGLLG